MYNANFTKTAISKLKKAGVPRCQDCKGHGRNPGPMVYGDHTPMMTFERCRACEGTGLQLNRIIPAILEVSNG